MAGVDVNDVETRLSRPDRRVAVPAAKRADVVLVHGPRLDGFVRVHQGVRGRERRNAAQAIGGVDAAVNEFDRGEAPVRVDAIGEGAEAVDVGVVPKAPLIGRRQIGRRMDLDLLGRHDAPSPLGLDRLVRQIGVGIAMTHARAMGNLVEAIARPDRPDLHRLEENVVSSVAHRPSRNQDVSPARRRPHGGDLALSVCGADATRASRIDKARLTPQGRRSRRSLAPCVGRMGAPGGALWWFPIVLRLQVAPTSLETLAYSITA